MFLNKGDVCMYVYIRYSLKLNHAGITAFDSVVLRLLYTISKHLCCAIS